jgi:hypothetical protein
VVNRLTVTMLRSDQVGPDNVVENTPNSLRSRRRQAVAAEGVQWLGGRDSNPDNVVQRGPKRRR